MDENTSWQLGAGCLNNLVGAFIAAIVSGSIAMWQISEGRSQSQAAIDSASEVAQDQARLTVQMDQVDQWRKSPQLAVLRSVKLFRNFEETTVSREVNCTIQNTGGRDLVIFEICLIPITPANEMKFGHVVPMMGPIIRADRSKVEEIDLSEYDIRRDHSFRIDPAIIVKPGESLTLKFVFPLGSPPVIVNADTNAADPQPDSGKLVDPFEIAYKLVQLFHFYP